MARALAARCALEDAADELRDIPDRAGQAEDCTIGLADRRRSASWCRAFALLQDARERLQIAPITAQLAPYPVFRAPEEISVEASSTSCARHEPLVVSVDQVLG